MTMALMVAAIAAITGFIVLAKRGRGKRRSMGRYIRGDMDEQLGLSTLGAKTSIKGNFDQVVNGRTLVSSVVAIYSMTAFTKSTGDGPILVGIAHGDYSATEIDEFLEATGSWDEGDKVQQEVSKRQIRRIGVFENPADEASAAVLNDGKAIKTKLNWILNDGQTLSLWAYNTGTSPLATTSPIVQAVGHANLWPR